MHNTLHNWCKWRDANSCCNQNGVFRFKNSTSWSSVRTIYVDLKQRNKQKCSIEGWKNNNKNSSNNDNLGLYHQMLINSLTTKFLKLSQVSLFCLAIVTNLLTIFHHITLLLLFNKLREIRFYRNFQKTWLRIKIGVIWWYIIDRGSIGENDG